jgi:hypothetical protein
MREGQNIFSEPALKRGSGCGSYSTSLQVIIPKVPLEETILYVAPQVAYFY